MSKLDKLVPHIANVWESSRTAALTPAGVKMVEDIQRHNVDLDDKMRDLKNAVEGAWSDHANAITLSFGVLSRAYLTVEHCSVNLDRGWITITGTIRDEADTYRTYEEISELSQAAFGVTGPLTGGHGSWKFSLGGWPGPQF